MKCLINEPTVVNYLKLVMVSGDETEMYSISQVFVHLNIYTKYESR